MDNNLKASDMFDIVNDSYYVHFNCFIWSYGILCDTNSQPLNIDKIVFESLTKKCFLCDLYGASLKCAVQDCPQIFHYSCAVLSGCYQNLSTHQILCQNHISQANIYFNNKCLLCDSSDRITEQLFCTSCGFYYHCNCLSPPIEPNPLTRIGWQCPECKICQTCHKPENDTKMIVCDTCDKCYHSYCLKNEIFLMKNSHGWKCDHCKRELSLTRACLSCKGLVFKDSIECLCETCQEIKRNLNQENNKKRSVKDLLQLSRTQTNSTSPEPSRGIIKKEPSSENVNMNIKIELPITDTLSKPAISTKPNIVTKKKQIPKKNNRNMKRSGQGSMNQMSMTTRGSRSRNSGKDPKTDASKRLDDDYDPQKKKSAQSDESTIGTVKRDEDDHHAVTVISSLDDSFSIRQDMCLSCGSFGKSDSGIVLSCSQCGQCFHTFCAGVNNICDVMLEKGWRCLDCTVCEGCGKTTDESRLLLCDDCDISYHIYCLDPPLEQVPQGNWKCKWCVKCIKCGTKTPGKDLEWKNNYTECALCNSLTICHVCNMNYNESDLIGKCTKCERWSHLSCKCQITEEEAEKKCQNFKCLKCSDQHKTDNLNSKKINSKHLTSESGGQSETLSFMDEIANLSKRCQVDEGIFLTDLGADLIKKLKIKPLPCPRRRVLKTNNVNNPDLESNNRIIVDENSQSSNEDKEEDNIDHESNVQTDKKQAPKRQINIGMGGFYIKSRRLKPQISHADDTNDNENKIVQKRKKKYTFEDMIPGYMQDAFFGQSTLANCQDANVNFDEPEEKFAQRQKLDVHRINLDENMLKMAQQNKKEHLELGIEDFLDGDIVSYLFNENRNLMEFHPEQDLTSNKARSKDYNDEKIFDEKIYEDLLHQIVSSDSGQKSNPVDEYLNLNHQPDNFKENPETVNDNRNIDDLARQFKESTHKYASNQAQNSIPNIDIYNNQSEFLGLQDQMIKVQTFIPEQVMRPPQVEQPKVINNQFNFIMTKMESNQTNNTNNSTNSNNVFQNTKFSNYVPETVNTNFQQPDTRSFGMQPTVMPSPQPKPPETPLENQISFEEQESSNDCFNNSGSKSGSKEAKQDDLSKHQKMLEKYAEDEELGEFATQAMPLYSNVNFPNLKNDMKDVQERYRYVHKIWRKLDGQVKLNYINKSRQNRYKKKSDEKGTVSKPSKASRAKSPLNSDVENIQSRSVTPSISMDDTNENSQASQAIQINQIAPGQILVCQLPAQTIVQQQQPPQQQKEIDQILHHHLQQQQLQQQQQQMQAKQEKITIKSYLTNQMNAALSSSSVASTSQNLVSSQVNSMPTQFTFSMPNSAVNQIIVQENLKDFELKKNDQVSDHIDSIIDQVVAGYGTVPSEIDWDDEETNSSFKEFVLSQMESSNSNDKPAKSKKKATKSNQEGESGQVKTTKKKRQKNETQPVETPIQVNQALMQNQPQYQHQQNQPLLDQTKINITIPQNINLNHRTIITNSATKINEILMINQQQQHQQHQHQQQPQHQPQQQNSYQQINSNNNVFLIPTSGGQFTLQEAQNAPQNKLICKDDNLKKILSIPGNELLIETPTIQSQQFQDFKKNLLVKNILVSQNDQQQQQQQQSQQHQQQQNTSLKFLQLDGQIDEFEAKNPQLVSVNPALVTNTTENFHKQDQPHFNPKLNSTKVVINHELLSSYGITYNPSNQPPAFPQTQTPEAPNYPIVNPPGFVNKSDNTLLKQLLNTAPKNAVPVETKPEVPKIESVTPQVVQVQVTQAEKPKKPKSDKPRTQKPKQQSKLLTDLKNKIESNLTQDNSDDTNPRKRKNVKNQEINNESLINKLLDEIKSCGSLSMYQPKIDKRDEIYKNINLPERDHFLKFRQFNLKLNGDLYDLKLSIEPRVKQEFFFNAQNCDTFYNKKLIQQSFKICSSMIDRPPELINGREMLSDSRHRLAQVLESEASNEKVFDEDSNMTDYSGQILFPRATSPAIELIKSEPHVKKEALLQPSEFVKTTLKLSQKASANFKETVEKLSEVLNFSSPGEFDLGKVFKSEPKLIENQKVTSHVQETLYSVQTLGSLRFNLCKFCEGFIDEDKENIGDTNKILFCSDYCQQSFRKLIRLKQYKQSLAIAANTNQAPLLDVTKKEKRVLKWSKDLASVSLGAETKEIVQKFELLKSNDFVDKRVCIFCKQSGDLDPNGPCRLLSIDVDQWSHLNCALWSDEVYETMNGALINVDLAFKKSLNLQCCYCHEKGASLRCFSPKCNCYYHLPCAMRDKCAFNQDKTIFCSTHSCKALNENRLTDLTVTRNVWIQRDEVAQIQSFMSRDFDENSYAIRIGSLVLHNVGQLLPHQLSSGNYNNRDYIYPIGYKATRIYWSTKNGLKRCRYLCCISETDGKPEYSVTIIEENEEKEILTDRSPSDIWKRILGKIETIRRDLDLVKLFPIYFSGEYMFGLCEPHIIRLVESLPGVETLTNYAFKFGRLQLLDMPLAINPTGCARSEPKLRTHFRKSRTLTCAATASGNPAQRSDSNGSANGTSSNGLNQIYENIYNDVDDEYSDDDEFIRNDSDSNNGLVSYTKQFVLSKSTQFKKLKAEWRQNVYLAKSKIQGLGLFAARDLEKNTMIIEYIGELIRNEVANRREKLYESQNRGIYMFRLNDELVVDATISGGLARYVNHCCDPNCIAETVSVEKDQKIIIIANKKILKGEELTYDYQFEFEDESNKIQCLCGSANCKKWMN